MIMCQEHTYVLAVKKLLQVSLPRRAQYIRVLLAEITCKLNHLEIPTWKYKVMFKLLTPYTIAFSDVCFFLFFFKRLVFLGLSKGAFSFKRVDPKSQFSSLFSRRRRRVLRHS